MALALLFLMSSEAATASFSFGESVHEMGHAGAIISGGQGTAAAKIAALEAAGAKVAPTPSDMASTLKAMMSKNQSFTAR